MYSVSIAIVFLLFACSLADDNVNDLRRRFSYHPMNGYGHGNGNSHGYYHGHGHGHGRGSGHGHGHGRGRGHGRGHDRGNKHGLDVYHHFRRQNSPKQDGLGLNLLCLGPNQCRRSESRFTNIIELMKLIQSIIYVHEEQKKISDGGSPGGGSKPGPGGGATKPGGGGGGGAGGKPGEGAGGKPGGGAGGKPGGGAGGKPGGGAGGKPGGGAGGKPGVG